MNKIIISKFCLDRDQKSCKVHLQDILPEIFNKFNLQKPGYRDGVILIPVWPFNFNGQIVTLQDNDVLFGRYKRRQENEEPRKQVGVVGRIQPDPLVAVDAVLYHRDVLAEGNENTDITADWEVITFLTKISKDEQPMPPETLMANHFLSSGGTATNMDDATFIAKLKESYEFWKNKALIR